MIDYDEYYRSPRERGRPSEEELKKEIEEKLKKLNENKNEPKTHRSENDQS